MSYNIAYSPQAVLDLEGILSYIQEDLESPIAATNVVNGILDAVDRLGLFPESGAKVKAPLIEAYGYRYVTSGNWMAFYRFENNAIYVDRVLYAKSNYLNILLQSEEPSL